MQKFNLNSYVRVNLNEKGIYVLLQHLHAEHTMVSKYIPFTEEEKNWWIKRYHFEGDWYEFQAWEFMHIFGPATQMGNWDMSWLDIYIKEEDLTKVEEQDIVK